MSPFRRRRAPVTIPTEPGSTVMAKGREFVIASVAYQASGQLLIELVRRDEYDRRRQLR